MTHKLAEGNKFFADACGLLLLHLMNEESQTFTKAWFKENINDHLNEKRTTKRKDITPIRTLTVLVNGGLLNRIAVHPSILKEPRVKNTKKPRYDEVLFSEKEIKSLEESDRISLTSVWKIAGNERKERNSVTTRRYAHKFVEGCNIIDKYLEESEEE